MTDVTQCLTARTGQRGDLDTESFILENAEPLQPVVGTLSPGAHGSGPGTVNGQDAYTGQLIPVQVTTAGGRELGDVAQTVLRYYGQGSDLDTQSWVVQDERWAGSASQDDIAAPLLADGGARFADLGHRRGDVGDRVVSALTTQIGTGGPDDNHAQAGWLIEQDTDG